MGHRLPIALCLLLVCSTAWAGKNRLAEGKRYYMKGAQAYDSERYAEAAKAFEKAYDIAKKGNLLFNVAKAYEKAGNLEKAHSFYGRFLEEVWDAPNAEAVRKVRDALMLKIEKAYPQITVNTDPPGAKIFLDNRVNGARGRSPVTFPVKPGPHRVIAEKEDHAVGNLLFVVKKGTNPALSMVLKKSKGEGIVALAVRPPGAVVNVNGEDLGKAPFPKPVPMKEGTYWVTVSAEGHETWTGTLLVTPDKTAKLSVKLTSTLPPEPFPYDTVALYTAIGGGAALALGGVAAALSHDTHGDLEQQHRGGIPMDQADIDAGKNYWLAGQVFAGLGAVSLVSAAVFSVLGMDDDGEPAKPPATAIVPSLRPDVAGVQILTHF